MWLWGVPEALPKCLYTSQLLPRTRKQDSAIALGGVQGQLVEDEDLVSGLEDAATAWLLSPSVWAPLGRTSWVIVPRTTAVLHTPSPLPRPGSIIFWIIRERNRGGRQVPFMSLFCTTCKVNWLLWPKTLQHDLQPQVDVLARGPLVPNLSSLSSGVHGHDGLLLHLTFCF